METSNGAGMIEMEKTSTKIVHLKNFPERWQSELRGINSRVYQVSV